jgi:hypothetical protein
MLGFKLGFKYHAKNIHLTACGDNKYIAAKKEIIKKHIELNMRRGTNTHGGP